MLLNSLSFRTGGQCTPGLEPVDGWLCAAWSGYVTTDDAMSGALTYLAQIGPFQTLCLDDVASAQDWLRACQHPINPPARLS